MESNNKLIIMGVILVVLVVIINFSIGNITGGAALVKFNGEWVPYSAVQEKEVIPTTVEILTSKEGITRGSYVTVRVETDTQGKGIREKARFCINQGLKSMCYGLIDLHCSGYSCKGVIERRIRIPSDATLGDTCVRVEENVKNGVGAYNKVYGCFKIV
ncbi:MAG: hypothetical protein AABW49_02380 [Nanoarchaeota archaeon]